MIKSKIQRKMVYGTYRLRDNTGGVPSTEHRCICVNTSNNVAEMLRTPGLKVMY